MSATLLGTSIIGFQRGQGSETAGHSINAATNEQMEPEFKAALPREIDRACRLADQAFPAFAARPAKDRAEFLRSVAVSIQDIGVALLERMILETGLPMARAEAERGRTCAQLKLFADVIEEGSWVDARIETALPDRQPMPKPDLRSMLRPIGPVAVFCPANFPLAYSVAGGDTASAFAAGCPVVVNAHSGHFGTAELVGAAIMRAARETNMPEGTFSLVFGRGHEAGQTLLRHPALCGVGFTGSRRGGRALMDLAAARPVPIPVYAEMSSVNPIFILPGALQERWGVIATGLHASVTTGVGQFCTKPGLVFIPAGKEADQFLDKLESLFSTTQAAPMLNAGIAENFEQGRSRLASLPAVKTVCQGAAGQAALFETTAQTFIENGVLHQEVFGPSTLVILCHGEADMIKCTAAIEGQLTATVHAADADFPTFERLSGILQGKAGRLIWNGYPTGLEVGHATVHGGPYPATSDGRTTSVGSAAIARWVRALGFQNYLPRLLPPELQDENPLNIWRLVNGQRTKAALT
ncbi:MAG: aldehyde dehydrogenase (NADP(+)) [Verrucomicrobiales bacterium]